VKTNVSIVRCNTYNPDEVQNAVEKAFDLLGGISSFIREKERVLIKPNLLSGRPAEDAVNTHLEVIRAVARLVKRCSAYPIIGDNPGGSASVRETYESSGISALAREEDIELAEPTDIKMVKGIPLSSYFFECNKIISLPKMKTHSLMAITGAIKNMFGTVSGLNKTECHKRFPKPQEFANVLVDVFESVRPNLVLMDAIIAMDGDGPASGNLKDVGLLIAGTDSVAMDSVFSALIGVNPFSILTTREAYRRGLGEANIENIQIAGQGLAESFIRGFRLPGLRLIMNLPNPVISGLAKFVRFSPYINERVCKKCRVCQDVCPVSAIKIDVVESMIDYHKCIRCMCCHEVCPYRAINLKRNILARVFGL
jgi:uncharacterized protein (DUF362 family)/Pyruvate/2-oxoacid:ferredoxin oxidoreductase delta subunit